MTRRLDYHRFEGTHREIGRAYGATCRELVHEHLRLVLGRLTEVGIAREPALAAALGYRPFVQEHAAFLDEEIVGVAEGAGIELAEAYLLQLRAEVYAELKGRPSAANECTTFAALPEATATGRALAGQNADLPPIYEHLMVVMHLVPDGEPEILMATPAGQVSYIGISSTGMATFANFLDCEGWGRGFPRYLFSRFALAQGGVTAAIEAVRALPRAASRNLMLLDAERAADFENTPTRDSVLEPEHGVLAHSNHYVAAGLLDVERASPRYLQNSRVRLARMHRLLAGHRGALSPEVMAQIMRDRADAPDALSVERGDDERGLAESDQSITVASVIAEPAIGRIWVTAGPPSRADYVAYDLDGGRRDDLRI